MLVTTEAAGARINVRLSIERGDISPRHRTLTCVDTAEEHAVVASAS